MVHIPLIEIRPFPVQNPVWKQISNALPQTTHLLFTSKSAVDITCNHVQHSLLEHPHVISVGSGTSHTLAENQLPAWRTAEDERAEGIVDILAQLDLSEAYLLWPHSSGARSVIQDWLNQTGVANLCVPIYDTVTVSQTPRVDPFDFDRIHFTSPSTVDAYWQLFGKPPQGIELTAIGPVTAARLRESLR